MDTTTWNTFDATTNISLNNGDKVYVRGILSADNNSSDYTQFKMSGKIAASGNCNSIWNYQDLNAPLKACCGHGMFSGCTSLNKITCLATQIDMSGTWNWLSGVSPSGIFIKSADMNDWPSGVSGIPEGWTVVDYEE